MTDCTSGADLALEVLFVLDAKGEKPIYWIQTRENSLVVVKT